MISWINEHSGALNVFLNMGMLCIWMLYFQLLFVTFRMQNRPNLLINRSAGNDADSRCIISNMSSSPVYIQAVVVELVRGSGRWTATISDTERLGEDESATGSMERTKQGPLGEGDFMDIGTFASVVRTAIEVAGLGGTAPQRVEDLDAVTITVTGVYTAVDRLIGASRTFRVGKEEGRTALRPETTLAKQVTSFRGRRELARLVGRAG